MAPISDAAIDNTNASQYAQYDRLTWVSRWVSALTTVTDSQRLLGQNRSATLLSSISSACNMAKWFSLTTHYFAEPSTICRPEWRLISAAGNIDAIAIAFNSSIHAADTLSLRCLL